MSTTSKSQEKNKETELPLATESKMSDSELLVFVKKQNDLIEQQRVALAKQQELSNELKDELRQLKKEQESQRTTYHELEKTLTSNRDISFGNVKESYDKNNIPKDDILKEDVVFSAFGIGIGFGSYMRHGQEVNAPYGMIMFKYQGTDVNQSGDPKHYSVYRTRSKKELEFIRNHPGYGTLFSENLNYTLSTDEQKHIKMAQIYSNLMNLQPDQIFSMAKYYGLENHGEVSKLREQLASIKMKEAEAEMNQKKNKFLEEQEKIALLKKEINS